MRGKAIKLLKRATIEDMGLRLSNTLSGKVEDFAPLDPPSVKVFVCGPTVYDEPHIGHARTYVIYDLLVKHLRYHGYRPSFIINITDIDDKVLQKAREEGLPFTELAERYTRSFFKMLEELGIDAVDAFPRASQYVEKCIELVRRLLELGFAYQVGGDVYFDTSRFPRYGELSHQSPLELRLRRLDPDPRKRSQSDFPLWRAVRYLQGDEGEVAWESPFGKGRPGWHMEDTAITLSELGHQYDIHGGAIDLIFPHHDAEIAQGEAITGRRPLVRYWVHTGIVKMKGRKMSKSLGNQVKVLEVLKRFDPLALRLYLTSIHYRRAFEFREERLELYSRWAEALRELVVRSAARVEGPQGPLGPFARGICSALDDDLDTPRALAQLLRLAKRMLKRKERGRGYGEMGVEGAELIHCLKLLGLLDLALRNP